VIRVGRGAILGADDRAGVAVLLEAARAWASGAPHCPLRIVLTISEERGMLGARDLDDALLRDCAAGYVLDSSTRAGTLIARTPTSLRFHARFLGRAAHAGIRPEEGRSAIQMAARAVDRMALGRLDAETTANVGIVEGGVAGNVVPPEARLRGESRSFRAGRAEGVVGEAERVCREAAAAFGGKVEWGAQVAFRSYVHERGAPVVERAWRAAQRAGLAPRLADSGGGSDANVWNERGLPVLNLGCGVTGNHSPEERIPICELEALLRLVLAIAEDAA